MSVEVGQVYENVTDHPGRTVRIEELVTDGETGTPAVRYVILSAPLAKLQRAEPGNHCQVPPATMLTARYRRIA